MPPVTLKVETKTKVTAHHLVKNINCAKPWHEKLHTYKQTDKGLTDGWTDRRMDVII